MSAKTDRFYNNFSFFYPLVDVLLRPQKQKFFNEINGVPFGNLLEIGVGNGRHLNLYKTHSITAIDTAARMLAKAKKHNNIRFVMMNGEHLQFEDQHFDYVVLSHVVAVVDNLQKMMDEVYRILKPGGRVFILNHFTPKNWMGFIDKTFSFFSKYLHFKSMFYLEDLATITPLVLSKEIELGKLAYFKILTFTK